MTRARFTLLLHVLLAVIGGALASLVTHLAQAPVGVLFLLCAIGAGLLQGVVPHLAHRIYGRLTGRQG